MYEYKQDGNALTDPPVYLGWRHYVALFGSFSEPDDNRAFDDRHLTNYQDVVLRLHNTWAANKESAYGNAQIIFELRKKLKKVKKALRS